MLSYQHAFHVGNHADVLKHLVLIAVIEKLNKKAKPYFVLDTHAGAGAYDVNTASDNADELAFENLLNHALECPECINRYLQILDKYLSQGVYPGSPIIASECARKVDSVHANELAVSMFTQLGHFTEQFLEGGYTLHLHQNDAFATMNALLPPMPKRGLVLIDPPYEQASEYEDVITAMSSAISKWPKGIYLLWYPLLSPKRLNRKTKTLEDNPKAGKSAQMLGAIKESVLAAEQCTGGLLSIEFINTKSNENKGMYGSGMCIVNPPYELFTTLEQTLKVLEKYVKSDNNNLSSLQWHLDPQ